MAVNDNNRYVWSDDETKVFSEFIHRTQQQFQTVNNVSFMVCNLYFYCLWQPCVTLPIPPPSDQTTLYSIVYLLQTIVGNVPNSHFLSCEFLKVR